MVIIQNQPMKNRKYKGQAINGFKNGNHTK